MLAGVAQIEITPPVGIALSGYIARRGPALGVHDPLYAKALVLDNGATQVALVTVDVLGLPRTFVATTRTVIAAQSDIPAANVLIACSHTHAGPATLYLQGCGEVDPVYLRALQERIVNVTVQAWANRQPARFGIGHGQVTDGVHNRRNPGAVIDPDLGIVRVDTGDGRPLAVLLNYACHPTCVTGENQLLSAEYCGYATARIQQTTDAITLFFTGAIGDVGPSRRGWDVLEQIGNAVAEEALRVLPTIAMTQWQTLTSTSCDLALPLQPLPTIADLAAFVAEQQRLLADPARMQQPYQPQIIGAMLNWTAATLTTVTAPAAPTTVTTELQVIHAGELTLVSAPGELFVELGLAVKAGAPTGHCFLCGFGNDNIGYIPTPHAYPQGGYEIADAYKYYGYPAALAPEAGQHYVATALQLL